MENTTRTCQTCSAPEPFVGAHCDLTDGSVLCAPCWNVEVARRAAARKDELADRPKCHACAKRPGTWNCSGALLCGRCRKTATVNAATGVPRGLEGLAMFAPVHRTPAQVIDLARR